MITIWVPKRLVEIDLCNVAARSPAQLVEISEASYCRRLRYAAKKIRQSGAKIIMLTGPSASGKTTTAHKLPPPCGTGAPPPRSSAWTISSAGRSTTPKCRTAPWITSTPTPWICP